MSTSKRIVAVAKLAYGEAADIAVVGIAMSKTAWCGTHTPPHAREIPRCGNCGALPYGETARCGSRGNRHTQEPPGVAAACLPTPEQSRGVAVTLLVVLPHLVISPTHNLGPCHTAQSFWHCSLCCYHTSRFFRQLEHAPATPPAFSGTAVSSSAIPRDSSNGMIPASAMPSISSEMEAVTPPHLTFLCTRQALYAGRGHAQPRAPFSTRSIYLLGSKRTSKVRSSTRWCLWRCRSNDSRFLRDHSRLRHCSH